LHGFNRYAGETSKEIPMLKGVVGLVTVLFVAGSAYAQEASHIGRTAMTPADMRALTDARIGIVKAALQLTPEQARYWPPIEEAIRARAEARVHRIAQLKTLAEQAGQREFNPVELMRGRAEALSQRGTNLKRLADAWQPLYQTLNPDQKERMRVLAMHVVREVKGALERHRMAEMLMLSSEEEEGDED
jgi:LTXXQ motif family protein